MMESTSFDQMYIADSSVYTVEKLIRKRKRQGSYEYLVKWRDYNYKFNTWEPEANILDQKLLLDFEKRNKSKQPFTATSDTDDSVLSSEEYSDNENKKINKKSKTGRHMQTRRKTRASKPVISSEQPQEFKSELPSPTKEEPVKEEEKKEHVSVSPPAVAVKKKQSGNPSVKLLELMKRSRKQAQTYGMQFSKLTADLDTNPTRKRKKDKYSMVSNEERNRLREIARKNRRNRLSLMTEEERECERERARDRMRLHRLRLKGCSSGILPPKRKRGRPMHAKSDSGEPHQQPEESEYEAGSTGCFSDTDSGSRPPVDRSSYKTIRPHPNGQFPLTVHPFNTGVYWVSCVPETEYPQKKFSFKPPTLDLSQKPLSDFVFKIEDLWATKVKETPVDALGYTVKIQESNTATSFFKPKY